jgi:hypothetical protein
MPGHVVRRLMDLYAGHLGVASGQEMRLSGDRG